MTKLTKIEQNIQAILFAAGEPYEKERLAKLLEIDRQTLEQLVERINEWYEDTPFILLELDQCYQMATRAEYAQVIRQALEVKNNTPLSQAALEAQKFSTILYTLLGMVQNIGRVKRTDIRIEPDFWGSGQERWQLRLSLTVHPIVAVAAAVRFAACFLRQLLSRKETDKPQQKDSTSCTTDSGKSAPQTQGAQQ